MAGFLEPVLNLHIRGLFVGQMWIGRDRGFGSPVGLLIVVHNTL